MASVRRSSNGSAGVVHNAIQSVRVVLSDISPKDTRKEEFYK